MSAVPENRTHRGAGLDVASAANNVIFGPWRYDRRLGRLLRQEGKGIWQPASIGSRAADLLAALLREPGAVVSKDDLVDAVWPGVTVEANNLTVQIAALRRVLDEGNSGPSYIQTVTGRGYRLVCKIDDIGDLADEPDPVPQAAPECAPPQFMASSSPTRSWAWPRIAALCVALGAILAAGGYGLWQFRPPELPRMSVVVLPFENLGGPDDAKLANALTEDLRASLVVGTPVKLVDGNGLQGVADRHTPPATIGRQLGARYAVVGSERRMADTLRLNVQIVSAETASTLWADRFDVSLADAASGQEAAVARLGFNMVKALVSLETARSKSERPNNPDAFDFYLRARSIEWLPPSPQRTAEIESLDENALRLDPSSNLYRLSLASSILNAGDNSSYGRKMAFERSASLIAEAEAQAPGNWLVMFEKLYWILWQEDRRCPEVVHLAEQFLLRYNKTYVSGTVRRWWAYCQIILGHADAAVEMLNTVLTLEPNSYRAREYRDLQWALFLLGRYEESIVVGERALAENPSDFNSQRGRLFRRMAAAYALLGRLDEARRKLAEALQIDPFITLLAARPLENASAVFVSQQRRALEGLKLAGLRDHAEEAADFSVASDNRLHQERKGFTPLDAPGAATIGTDALVQLLASQHPLVIDAVNNFAGLSIPGAVGLRYVGDGGTLTDMAQDRLRMKMRDLTHGDLNAPLVAVGWNSESFDGRNLALRLVALGYSHVWWYRGGREAWEVNKRPEAYLMPQDW